MPTGEFGSELRARVAAIVGEQPPATDGDPLVFVRAWLGERNLGLVPIAEPQGFSWPGYWIARSGDRAVLMYGSPSGPVDGELVDGRIDAGWLVASLDLHLGIDRPYGADAGSGVVAALLVAPDAERSMTEVEEATAVAGRGLEGDRYAAGRGTFGGPRGYELTLVEAEALEAVGVSWVEARRNVVTRGVALNALVGRRFQVGEVECVGRRLAEPCAHLERLIGRTGLLRPLVHRAGLRADILDGGEIRVGDAVRPAD